MLKNFRANVLNTTTASGAGISFIASGYSERHIIKRLMQKHFKEFYELRLPGRLHEFYVMF